MQKFGFLNHGLTKDVSSRGIHLQSVFSARTDHFTTQAAGESRADFTDTGPGIFCIGCFECCGKYMDGSAPVFK